MSEQNIILEIENGIATPGMAYSIKDLDSEKPLLKLGNQVFEGRWEYVVGTELVFNTTTQAPSEEEGEAQQQLGDFSCAVRKKLVFRKAKLEKKNATGGAAAASVE